MKLERSDIEFPLWRKKVDTSLFKDAATPLPKFLWRMWNIDSLFNLCRDKNNSDSKVIIFYEKKEYIGRIIYSSTKNMYRLFFEKELGEILKDVFLMSYMMYNPLVIEQAVMMKIEQLWISVRGVQI
ncbi:MAG: hypothetical protein V4585_07220 [Bacteroidota bacterium]